jgi:serine protease Do
VRTLLSTANAQSEKEGYVSEIKAMGKAVPGKDVAVLKIEADNLPTVVLGKADAIGTGDATYALGYPAIATLDDSKPIEATFTSGVISAKKTMPDGWSVLQTDTTISHGSSGGPVFNPDGKVIGVATFGSVDPQTGEAVQGINFVVPINIVEEFLDQANVEPGEGRLSQLYREGIQLEAQERYHAALKKFQEVEDLNAQFPYIQQQISKTRKATVDHPESKLPLVLGVVSGGLSASGAAFLLVRRLRRFRTQQKAVPHS